MGYLTGFGALNLDLIFEVGDFKTVSSEELRLEAGKEVFGSDEEFRLLLERLNRFGTLKSKSGGGSAANTIVAMAGMGFPTRFIGKVGKDEEGDFLIENLGPVQTQWIQQGGRSGICLVVLDRHQDRFLFVQGNANNTLATEEIPFDAMEDISWLHLTSFIGELPFEAQVTCLNRMDGSVKVSIDPGEIYAKKGLDRIRPLIERSFIIFVTEREIKLLTHKNMLDGARSLLEIGPSVLVCKRGSHGSHIFSREGDFEAPAIPVEVVDNTGAGDVYNAGFLAGLLSLKPLKECALLATMLAAKSLTGYGREQYPTREDLQAFFR
jgi:sugar/nucleoside kinase (ribokinase family)